MNWHAPRLKCGDVTLLNFAALKPAEAEMVRRWRNSAGVRRWMYSSQKITKAEHAAFCAKIKTDKENGYWLAKGPGRAAFSGVVYLNRVDRVASSAYLGVYANPESDAPGRGTELMRALTWLAFHELGLKTLKLEVFADNLKATTFYRRCHFRTVRLLKGSPRSAGVAVRVMLLDRKEWSDADGI